MSLQTRAKEAAVIDSEQRLRALYPAPGERALRKQMARLDRHALRFVALSPFVVLATADAQGRQDASPRGGAPGFVRAEAQRLWIPDAPGNHRLDSLSNIVAKRDAACQRPCAAARRRRGAAAVCRRPARASGGRGRRPRGLPALRQGADAREALVRRGAGRTRRAAEHGPDESQAQMLARYAKDL